MEEKENKNPEVEGLEINNNREIVVPEGIRFISDWKDYSLHRFPFQHILDKKIPGCGYTEYCIRSFMPIILCSPRKILLENKAEQHKGEVFYFRNELETDLEMDKDLTKVSKSESSEGGENTNTTDDKRRETYKRLKKELIDYINDCYSDYKNIKPPKILVTYDSFRLVKEILKNEGRLGLFYVVVDEFQSIFTDSRFKSTTELEFVNQLKDLQKVCYVSATPMIDKYLSRLKDFAELPYYELDWVSKDPTRAIKPDLKVRIVSSITTKAVEIIKTYKEGNFDKSVSKDSEGNIQTIESKEAVFYVNSVNNIISIINKAGLTPKECNILCSRTDNNEKRIKTRLPKGFSIGRVPLKGETNKMFTFCTRTVYLGADFYSTNARSFILSDANSECLAVDISLDLPQILGRQRDLSNPWKNRAEFYYKTLGKNKGKSQEEFMNILQTKIRKTNELLDAYGEVSEQNKHALAETFQRDAKTSNYKYNYVAVNVHGGTNLVPEFNDLVVVAEERAFDIQQVDYKDRFSVFNTIASEGLIESKTTCKINSFLDQFYHYPLFRMKMSLLCETNFTDQELGIILDQIPLEFRNYYQTLGPERCKALSYDVTYISREYSDLQFDKSKLQEEIYKEFQVNSKYSKSFIKDKLCDIYKTLGYNKTPKANDLEEYFELKTCQVTNKETGKRDMAFEILGVK